MYRSCSDSTVLIQITYSRCLSKYSGEASEKSDTLIRLALGPDCMRSDRLSILVFKTAKCKC